MWRGTVDVHSGIGQMGRRPLPIRCRVGVQFASSSVPGRFCIFTWVWPCLDAMLDNSEDMSTTTWQRQCGSTRRFLCQANLAPTWWHAHTSDAITNKWGCQHVNFCSYDVDRQENIPFWPYGPWPKWPIVVQSRFFIWPQCIGICPGWPINPLV